MTRAQNKDNWTGCPTDNQTYFSGCPQNGLVVRIFATVVCFTILKAAQPLLYCFKPHKLWQDSLQHARKQCKYFGKSFLLFDCPTAKWVVLDARNALISCPDDYMM